MVDEQIKRRIESILPLLNERQCRLYLAAEANSYGWGGKTKISALSGRSRMMITRGEKEFQILDNQINIGRIRRNGGGRKKEINKQPHLVETIKKIIEPHTIVDPESLLLWTSKSLQHIKPALAEKGFDISHELIRQILKNEGYILQTNRKTQEGGKHIDRDAQFEYIDNTAKSFIAISQLYHLIARKKN